MPYETSRRSWILHALAAAAALVLLIAEPAPAQSTGSVDRIWEQVAVPEAELTELAEPEGPRTFLTYTLDRKALDAILDRVPPARLVAPDEPAVREVPLPMPDGTRRTFRVRASPVLAPDLEARYPQIRTFEGRQVDDPAITVRFDVFPEGVTGRVFFPDRTSPFSSNDVIIAATEAFTHTSAFLSDYTPPQRRCLVEGEEAAAVPESVDARPPLSSGRDLRTYRLAVAATGEFTQANGGTVESVLLRIARTVNTLNEIYERDLAIRFQLVAGNDQVIFTDGRTDPFDNDDIDALLQQSQTTLDCFIGDENYDVGHTFSAGDGGGLANLNVAGVSRQKGTGATSASSQGQTVFDVDYVAHELGHQFGATHTYNGSAGDCTAKSRSGGTAYEPGSGSTIMGYAGVCDVDNLQPSSGAYFHSASLVQIRNHVERGLGSHPPPVLIGNQPPNVDAGDAYVIPIETPFTLTATSDDPDGDALTYCWEELDLGSQRPLVAPDDGQSPLFRSFPPTASPSRTFPRYAGHPALPWIRGEQRPALERVMRFRVTARDDHRGGGGVASDETTVTVHEEAGPFEITSPGSGSHQAGLLYLEWEVAGTNVDPVSVDRVNLSFLPEDNSPPIPLLFDTSNDGQELVALTNPANAARGRLKLESVGNVFFTVTDDITLAPARATVFVVRHAEKEEGEDPPLKDPEGVDRARALAYLLASSQIDQIYSTPTRRTRQTAQPTAKAFGLNILEYGSTAELLAKPGVFENGHHVLVVGHSDTVPEILRDLGVTDEISIEDDFDRLFIVFLTDDGVPPRLWPFRYDRHGGLQPEVGG